MLTGANIDDRNKNVIDTLTNKMFGKLYTDKGSLSLNHFLGNFLMMAFISSPVFVQT
ncbi:hypothetical protein OXV68_15275 [Bacteroides fragilis]|nr:hypothetical protein [Bacteroides fragilis]